MARKSAATNDSVVSHVGTCPPGIKSCSLQACNADFTYCLIFSGQVTALVGSVHLFRKNQQNDYYTSQSVFPNVNRHRAPIPCGYLRQQTTGSGLVGLTGVRQVIRQGYKI
jgi:hypothetical protein